jgi:uncharacterized membrane protein (GlpM family)
MIYAIIGGIIWAIICAYMANNRGRNWILGAISGFFFTIFAVIYYWIVGDTQELRDIKEVKRIKRIKKLMK